MDKKHSEAKAFTLWLSMQPKIGPVTFKKLLDESNGDIDLLQSRVFDPTSLFANRLSLYRKEKDVYMSKLANLGVEFKTVWEEEYPSLLKELPDPPPIIFFRGNYNSNIFKRVISIVGSRKNTSYGQRECDRFVSNFSNLGFTICSGMAVGIDALAHKAAISNKGKTIAVLGTPVNVPSPSINSNLYREIIDSGGLIISEYFPGTPTDKGMFARRNRIIAGLAMATLVVEAGQKSGALITANLAMDYNRDVYAIPGNIDRESSLGCNLLIRESKAKLVTSPSDLLEDLGFGVGQNNLEEKQKKLLELTENERIVYNSLLEQDVDIGFLSTDLNLGMSELLTIITNLELRGIVKKSSNGNYVIV